MPPRPLVSLEELIGSVLDRAPDSSDIDRLGVAVALSHELAALGDELVGHFVDAARQNGCSWAQIGQLLGVTRQAAQQRFVVGSQGGPRMFERFGDDARRVVDLAQEEAVRLGHDYLGTEHLVLGLLADGQGAAARALEALGVSAETVRARTKEIIGEGRCRVDQPVPFTPRSTKVLQLAVREAKRMGDDEVRTEHVLLGIVGEGQGVAAEILGELGADEQRVRLQLSALLGRPCPPGRIRSRRRRAFGLSK